MYLSNDLEEIVSNITLYSYFGRERYFKDSGSLLLKMNFYVFI